MSARFSHAVGGSPGGAATGLTGAGADVHAAMSHSTGRTPNTRVTASWPEYENPSPGGVAFARITPVKPGAPIPATLTELMGGRAAQDPDTPYFHLFDEAVPYGRLWRESARYAAGLERAGIDRGDKVCLIYPTCAEFFYTFFGALRLGAVPVPLYPTLGVEATANIFRDSEAKAVATIGWFRKGVEESQAAASNIRHVLEPSDLEVDDPAPPFPTAAADDVAFIQYTSGSTGQPRGVVLSHANVVRTVEFMAEAAQLTRDDVVVSWLPLYHDMGLIGCAFTPPWSGAPLHLLPPDLKNPRVWLELVTRVGATFTVSPDFGYRNCVRNIHDTERPRSLLAQAGALRRRAGAPQHHRGLRAEVRRRRTSSPPATGWPRPPWPWRSGRAGPRSAWTARAGSSRSASPAAACRVRIMDDERGGRAGRRGRDLRAEPRA